jgi:hypothetical protein
MTNQAAIDREAFRLDTRLRAMQLLRETLREHLSRQEPKPTVFKARPEVMRQWERQIDVCIEDEREITERLSELAIDKAYAKSEPEPPATVAMPQRSRRKKPTTKGQDYGT